MVDEARSPAFLVSLLKPCEEVTWAHFPDEDVEVHLVNRGSPKER